MRICRVREARSYRVKAERPGGGSGGHSRDCKGVARVRIGIIGDQRLVEIGTFAFPYRNGVRFGNRRIIGRQDLAAIVRWGIRPGALLARRPRVTPRAAVARTAFGTPSSTFRAGGSRVTQSAAIVAAKATRTARRITAFCTFGTLSGLCRAIASGIAATLFAGATFVRTSFACTFFACAVTGILTRSVAGLSRIATAFFPTLGAVAACSVCAVAFFTTFGISVFTFPAVAVLSLVAFFVVRSSGFLVAFLSLTVTFSIFTSRIIGSGGFVFASVVVSLVCCVCRAIGIVGVGGWQRRFELLYLCGSWRSGKCWRSVEDNDRSRAGYLEHNLVLFVDIRNDQET